MSVFPYQSNVKNELSAFSHPQLNKQQNSKRLSTQNNWVLGEYISDIMFRKHAVRDYLVMLEISMRYSFVQQVFNVVFDVDAQLNT